MVHQPGWEVCVQLRPQLAHQAGGWDGPGCPAALCLNEYQSWLRATAPPSPRACDWFIGDQPGMAGESCFISVHSLTTMRLNT